MCAISVDVESAARSGSSCGQACHAATGQSWIGRIVEVDSPHVNHFSWTRRTGRPHRTPRIQATQTPGGRHPECWMLVEGEEAYIHCSKHVPLLQKMDKDIHWGTDDEHEKGGDYFKAKACSRPWGTDATHQG
jgi:hypothetical protein